MQYLATLKPSFSYDKGVRLFVTPCCPNKVSVYGRLKPHNLVVVIANKMPFGTVT